MDFIALIIFLALYYVRPQEWFSAFSALRPVQVLSVIALWAMAKDNKLKPKELVQTPLDWLILCYFVWTLIAGFQFSRTLGGIEAVLLFYFVAVRSLDSVHRQKVFLGWWCAFIVFIAALAIASMYGFDPLGSNDITQGPMKGRLMLNLSIFNNPNGLGHSVIPAVPLIYYLLFWRRTFMRVGVLVMAIPLYCVYLTQSKGAFVCGFATILATLAFGRSKPAQIIILVLALAFGYGALFALPRMNELSNAKNDTAIQGRVAALTYGLQLMRTHYFGIGLGNFQQMFTQQGPLEKVIDIKILPARTIQGNDGAVHEIGAKRVVKTRFRHFLKATHCAYNQNGAELGYVGLFLFVGILYCCIRTLLLVKSQDDDEERIRRALFATVVAYAASSWMVDFCYRPTFFMFVASISAFHRHLLRKNAAAALPEQSPEPPILTQRPWLRRIPPIKLPDIPGLGSPVPAGSAAKLPTQVIPPPAQPAPAGAAGNARVLAWHKPDSSFTATLAKQFIWNRLGVIDYVIMLALTYAAIRYWEHLIATM